MSTDDKKVSKIKKYTLVEIIKGSSFTHSRKKDALKMMFKGVEPMSLDAWAKKLAKIDKESFGVKILIK